MREYLGVKKMCSYAFNFVYDGSAMREMKGSIQTTSHAG